MLWIIFTILIVLALVASVIIGGVVQRLSNRDRSRARTAPPASAEEDDYLSARRKGGRDRLEDLANDKNLIAKVIGFGGPIALGLLWMIVTFAMSFHQVPAGHVGVVFEFGGIVGQTGDGAQWVAPWRDVTKCNLRFLQRRTFLALLALDWLFTNLKLFAITITITIALVVIIVMMLMVAVFMMTSTSIYRHTKGQ